MKPIPLREQRLVRKEAKGFVLALQRAMDKSHLAGYSVPVTVTLAEFYDNPVLLYLALWYADTMGVRVNFEPTAAAERTAATASSPEKP